MMQCMLINSNTGVNVTHPSSFFNISGIYALTVSWVIREFKQRRRWRLRKRHLKSEVALLETLLFLFHLFQFIKCWQFSLELNSKRLYRISGKENESRCLVFTSSIKREIRHFHVVVMRWRQRNVQKKRDALAELLFCQAKPTAFLLSSLTSPSSLLKFPIIAWSRP